MREIIFTVKKNEQIAREVYRMNLEGDTSEIKAPGQFINIKLDDKYLRRPISICDWNDKELTIIYKVVGSGTHEMSKTETGKKFSVLIALGNGYDLSIIPDDLVIVGGGVGVPPLYGLAKKLIANSIKPEIILGFNTLEDCFYIDEFKNLGLKVKVTTLDGSCGTKGLVTDVLTKNYACVCGPLAMLRAVYKKVQDGQFSFESRMGCGFGVCMGCSMRTKNGFKRICTEGPILKHSDLSDGSEILF